MGDRIKGTLVSDAADACIRKHAVLAGAVGLVPIPIADIAGVGAVQVRMIQQLAEIHGVALELDVVKELIGTMAGAKLTQVAFQWIASHLKYIPGPGTVAGEIMQGIVSVTITYAMGKATKLYFENEQKMTAGQLTDAYRQNLKEGRDFAQANVSALTTAADNDEFKRDLAGIQAGLAKNLGRDAEFVEKLGSLFGQIRRRVEEEQSVDAELRDLLTQANPGSSEE